MSIQKNDLQRLQELGMISGEQCSQIADFRKPPKKKPFSWVSSVMFVLSAGMIVIGLNRLIAAYWEQLDNLIKIGAVAMQIVAAWIIWFFTRRRRPVLAQFFAFLAVGLWFYAVNMFNSIYRFSDETVDIMAVMFLGVVLIPFVTRQVLMVGFVAIFSAVLWSKMTESAGDSPLALNLDSESNAAFFGYVGISLLWSLLGEKWRLSSGMYRGYGWIAVFASFCFMILMASLCYRNDALMRSTSLDYLCCLAPVVLFAFIRPKFYPWRWWMLFALVIGALMLVQFVPLGFSGFDLAAIRLSVFALVAAFFMFCGTKCRRITWLVYGAATALFVTIALGNDILDSVRHSSPVLVIGGWLLIFIAGMKPKPQPYLHASGKVPEDAATPYSA